MMLKSRLSNRTPAMVFAAMLALTSCVDGDPETGRFTLQDTADLADEALTDAYFQDLDDMAGIAVQAPAEEQLSSGRAKTSVIIEDHRFACDAIVVTVVPDDASTAGHPKGVLTVDFGATGCEDLKGNIRKGKVMFAYDGKRFVPGSSVVVTTDNYFINDIKLEGTRTLTNIQNSSADAPRFTALLENGKATFPNSLVATRESEITWRWNRAANPNDDYLEVEADSWASGTTRLSRTYEVQVLEPLLYKRHCGIAVSGVKRFTAQGGKQITVDYGDGDCDRHFTIAVDGATRDINL